MCDETKRSGTNAPPTTPLIPASPSLRLSKCLEAYAVSISEIEKYNALIITRDIQRECERKSSSQYRLMIRQTALSLNECALKEAIMCIIS